jgi:transposase
VIFAARANKLRAVSMDMTGGYAKSVLKHAPQATIVIDNYHVVALASKALDEVRREHWNELRTAGQTDTAKQFKADRWALLKNPDQLTDRQASTLAAVRASGGKVARAWAMKEMVRAIFAPGLTSRPSTSCSTGSWPASRAADCNRSPGWAKRSASTARASSRPVA